MRKYMRGVWLENQDIKLRNDLPVPKPTTNEALIKVLMAGICGTDLQLLKGYYPFTGIPGHEFVGEVIEATNAPHLTGKRVVGEINIGCGHCGLCHTGLSRHCPQRQVVGIKNRHGAFAEFMTMPVANLHALPDHLPDEKAVFTEPIAAAAHILEQTNITPAHKVIVIGAGRLGLLIAQVINTTQCRLQVVARHDNQRHILAQFNIDVIGEHQLAVREADIVIEASGAPSGLLAAVKAVKPTGTIVLKSTYAGEPTLDFSNIVVNEINIIGSRCGPFEPAISLLQTGKINPVPLIHKQFTMDQAMAAFAAAALPGSLKILLRP